MPQNSPLADGSLPDDVLRSVLPRPHEDATTLLAFMAASRGTYAAVQALYQPTRALTITLPLRPQDELPAARRRLHLAARLSCVRLTLRSPPPPPAPAPPPSETATAPRAPPLLAPIKRFSSAAAATSLSFSYPSGGASSSSSSSASSSMSRGRTSRFLTVFDRSLTPPRPPRLHLPHVNLHPHAGGAGPSAPPPPPPPPPPAAAAAAAAEEKPASPAPTSKPRGSSAGPDERAAREVARSMALLLAPPTPHEAEAAGQELARSFVWLGSHAGDAAPGARVTSVLLQDLTLTELVPSPIRQHCPHATRLHLQNCTLLVVKPTAAAAAVDIAATDAATGTHASTSTSTALAGPAAAGDDAAPPALPLEPPASPDEDAAGGPAALPPAPHAKLRSIVERNSLYHFAFTDPAAHLHLRQQLSTLPALQELQLSCWPCFPPPQAVPGATSGGDQTMSDAAAAPAGPAGGDGGGVAAAAAAAGSSSSSDGWALPLLPAAGGGGASASAAADADMRSSSPPQPPPDLFAELLAGSDESAATTHAATQEPPAPAEPDAVAAPPGVEATAAAALERAQAAPGDGVPAATTTEDGEDGGGCFSATVRRLHLEFAPAASQLEALATRQLPALRELCLPDATLGDAEVAALLALPLASVMCRKLALAESHVEAAECRLGALTTAYLQVDDLAKLPLERLKLGVAWNMPDLVASEDPDAVQRVVAALQACGVDQTALCFNWSIATVRPTGAALRATLPLLAAMQGVRTLVVGFDLGAVGAHDGGREAVCAALPPRLTRLAHMVGMGEAERGRWMEALAAAGRADVKLQYWRTAW